MRPEIINGLFALGGALIGVAGTWLVTRSTRAVRKLTILQSPTTALLDVAVPVRSDVQILFKGQPVNALAIGEIAVVNTGTAPIEAVQLFITPKDGSPIADISRPRTNFEEVGESTSLNEDSGAYRVHIPYLNPRDRVIVEYRVVGARQAPIASTRIMGVDVKLKKETISWLPGIYADRAAEMATTLPFYGFFFRMIKPFSLYVKWKREHEILANKDK